MNKKAMEGAIFCLFIGLICLFWGLYSAINNPLQPPIVNMKDGAMFFLLSILCGGIYYVEETSRHNKKEE